MKKITIILPIHKIDGDYKEMLTNAISSIEGFHNDVILSIIATGIINLKNGKAALYIGISRALFPLYFV